MGCIIKYNSQSILTKQNSIQGVLPDPEDCQCFYICNPQHVAVRECCNIHELFDSRVKVCNFDYNVNCGDRPLPGETTTKKTTPTTVNHNILHS